MGSLDCPDGPWFNEVASALGPRYWAPGTDRVMSFTKGTEQEVDYAISALNLEPGMRVLDVGCGPGRHSLEFARRGYRVHGFDLSDDFVDLARASATAEGLDVAFKVLDVREMAFESEFDAAICLCQGGFGLLGGADDAGIIGKIASAVNVGGGVMVSAFSSYFALRHLETNERFDLETGVLHEIAELQDQTGVERTFDLWTTCFTARELHLVAASAGLDVQGVHGVAPGRYGPGQVTIQDPEILLIAFRGLAR
ncbi:MAG: class I SAM-dependent methyltransferase [Acidimicrobiia bacterium]|nr:class I SAM-dependent methyltransferase [Acidimicrobiia bacterium]